MATTSTLVFDASAGTASTKSARMLPTPASSRPCCRQGHRSHRRRTSQDEAFGLLREAPAQRGGVVARQHQQHPLPVGEPDVVHVVLGLNRRAGIGLGDDVRVAPLAPGRSRAGARVAPSRRIGRLAVAACGHDHQSGQRECPEDCASVDRSHGDHSTPASPAHSVPADRSKSIHARAGPGAGARAAATSGTLGRRTPHPPRA